MKAFILFLCTVSFACTAQQQLPKSTDDSNSGGTAGTPGDAAIPIESPDAEVPACPVSTIGCPCDNGQCTSPLQCKESLCASSTCGDGNKDPSEECDLGKENNDSTYGGCKKSCALGPRCGDGIKNGTEACDDGNADDGDGCSNACAACSARQDARLCGGRCVTGIACCAGEQCGSPLCSASTFTSAQICTSAGQCPVAVKAECSAGFACSGTACRTTCSSDQDCAAGRTCPNGACITKGCGNGVIEPPETCEDGNKVDDDACSNGCLKCSDRPGYKECSVNGAVKCLANAVCCPGATCRTAACSGQGIVPAQTCNDKGECPASVASVCPGNFVCESNACRNTCTANGQCTSGRVCYKGDCIVAACGNGEVEPGESCDNGAGNADSGTCGLDCKTCLLRGRKECGGVCLPVGQCCNDGDCPSATTAGKCNMDTRMCWKQKVTTKLPLVSTGGCVQGLGCGDGGGDMVVSNYWGNGDNDQTSFVRFTNSIPAGAVLEKATLTVVQKSFSGSFGTSAVRVDYCPGGGSYESVFKICGTLTDASPVLCAQPNSPCSLDVTSYVRANKLDFLIGFSPEPNPFVEVSYFGKNDPTRPPSVEVVYFSN